MKMALNVKAKEVVYFIEAPDGSKVDIHYTAEWSCLPELKHRVDLFEYRGDISSTGYQSEFVTVGIGYKGTKEKVLRHAKEMIEKFTDTKYGEPTQAKLI